MAVLLIDSIECTEVLNALLYCWNAHYAIECLWNEKVEIKFVYDFNKDS